MPNFRLAENKDFDALYNIWMQDHINPFMSFEQTSKQVFLPIFNTLLKSSDIYVIEESQQIVAARRIIYGIGNYDHVAYFASFGVHKEHLGKGYGKAFYNFFIDILRSEKPHIMRIELSQETDNTVALELAKKREFEVEIISPEYLLRTTGTHKDKWYVGSRFLALLLTPEIKIESIGFDQFAPKLPSLISPNNLDLTKLTIKKTAEKIYCYFDNKAQASCTLESGVRRNAHIQTWLIELESNCNQAAIYNFLRIQMIESALQHKKVEILISDTLLLDIVAELGFHYRGQKIASRKVKSSFYNEVYADFNFFNIENAKTVIMKNEKKDDYTVKRILAKLTKCHNMIEQANEEKKIDEYGCLYLENLAFQMIREEFTEMQFYDKKTAPWGTLIKQLPSELNLQGTLEELALLINPMFHTENQIADFPSPQSKPLLK